MRLTRPAGTTATVPADFLEAVCLVDGERSLSVIIEQLAEVRGASAAELGGRIRPVFLKLYERGFLIFGERPASS